MEDSDKNIREKDYTIEIMGLVTIAIGAIAAAGYLNDMSNPVSEMTMRAIQMSDPIEFARLEMYALAQKMMALCGSPLGGILFYGGRILNRHENQAG